VQRSMVRGEVKLQPGDQVLAGLDRISGGAGQHGGCFGTVAGRDSGRLGDSGRSSRPSVTPRWDSRRPTTSDLLRLREQIQELARTNCRSRFSTAVPAIHSRKQAQRELQTAREEWNQRAAAWSLSKAAWDAERSRFTGRAHR